MKKMVLIILMLSSGKFSAGQELSAEDFYTYLREAIKSAGREPISLAATEYGCLGSKTNWQSKIKSSGELIEVSFYSQRPEDPTKASSELKTSLDTSFTVDEDIFRKNLEDELIAIKSRLVFIEASFKISLSQGTSKREFIFRRGEGLYYLLRFNKTWASYFVKK